jgi:hypothetical protein
MTIINKAIIILIIIITVAEILALALWVINPQTQENNFFPAEYANQNGYEKQFQYQGQWYENIDGEWQAVEIPPYENHARIKGFTKYFYYDGNWYGNVNGEWKIFNSKEEAKQASGF